MNCYHFSDLSLLINHIEFLCILFYYLLHRTDPPLTFPSFSFYLLKEYYTSNTRNVRTYAGKLVIEAREEHGAERAQVQQHCWDACGQRCNTVSHLRSGSPELHQCVVACGQARCPNVRFTSARLSTYGKFSIAPSDKFSTVRIEARISLTPGLGLWPAFWMLPLDKRYGEWPASGEIDIMESHSRMNAVNGTLHFGGTGGAYRMISDTSPQITPGFHVYRVDWSAKEIRWFVDHKLFAQIPNTHWHTTGARSSGEVAAPFGNNKFYILLNMAVGGAYPGYPTPDSVAAALATGPKRMVVDYVRVYGRP